MSEKTGQRARRINQVLWIILFLNIAVALAKFLYGYFSHSASMQADGIHSFFDGASNVVGIVGIMLASRPADYDHPYGHSKYETYASAVIGVMLLFAAYNVGSTAIVDLISKNYTAEVDWGSFLVMVGTLAVNISVTLWERSVGKKLESEILIADASHTLSDVFVSMSVIVGLVLVRLGVPIADPIMALIVSVAILYTAYGVFKQANSTLSDSARIPIDDIKGVVLSVPGVQDCHRVRTRGSAAEVYVDLHVMVDGNETVNHGHEVASQVTAELHHAFPQIVDVVAHIEPNDEKQRLITIEEERGFDEQRDKVEKLKEKIEKEQ